MMWLFVAASPQERRPVPGVPHSEKCLLYLSREVLYLSREVLYLSREVLYLSRDLSREVLYLSREDSQVMAVLARFVGLLFQASIEWFNRCFGFAR